MKQNAMEMVIKVKDKTEIARLMSILNLGLCTAIEQGVLPIATAEDYFYSPYTLEKLEALGLSPQILRLVQLGTELEDIASLLPEKLAESLAEMKQAALEILQTLPAPDADQQWVQTTPITSHPVNATNGLPIPTRQTKIFAASQS